MLRTPRAIGRSLALFLGGITIGCAGSLAYGWADSLQDVPPTWITLSIVVAGMAVMGVPFVVPALRSLPLMNRIEISAIIGGGAFTLVTAVFLVGEYGDQRQARITRAWQLLFQSQDRAALVVCEARRPWLGEQAECSAPPAIPSFVGSQELFCEVLRHATPEPASGPDDLQAPRETREGGTVTREAERRTLLEDWAECSSDVLPRLTDEFGVQTICNVLEENGMLFGGWLRCGDPVAVGVGVAHLWPEQEAIREAMRPNFGHLTAVQTLFDTGVPTQGLRLPWFNLAGIRATPGQDLRRANFSGADLDRAELAGVILGGEIERTAAGATSGPNLDLGANLSGAYLRGATLADAALAGADLSNVRGDDAILTEAVLRCADLGYAWLRGADLRGADLIAADLVGADLSGADLDGARLLGAVLTSTELRGVKGLIQTQLDEACVDPGRPPHLVGSVDAASGEPLVWGGEECLRVESVGDEITSEVLDGRGATACIPG